MKYLLDTNICIYLVKQKPRDLLRKFERHMVGEIAISSITVAELRFGVAKSQYSSKNQRALEQFLIPLMIVDFDHHAAAAYGQIRAYLAGQGTPIGALDTLIAAQAVSLELALVTNNVKEFRRVPALALENWVDDRER